MNAAVEDITIDIPRINRKPIGCCPSGSLTFIPKKLATIVGKLKR
jgi:hypothetical protein